MKPEDYPEELTSGDAAAAKETVEPAAMTEAQRRQLRREAAGHCHFDADTFNRFAAANRGR